MDPTPWEYRAAAGGGAFRPPVAGHPVRGRTEIDRRGVSRTATEPRKIGASDTPSRPSGLAHIAGMAERVAAGLRPHRQPVRLGADRDRGDGAVRRVDRIDDVVVPRRQPQELPVGADIAHVGASAARYRPIRDDLPGLKIEDRDAARAAPPATHVVRAAVDDIELGSVAARGESGGGDG